MERANRDVMGGSMEDPLITDIVSNGNNIPFIMTNENLEVLNSTWFPKKIIDHPDRLRRQIDKFTAENPPRTVRFWSSATTTTSSSTGDRHCSNRSTTSPMSRYWS